MTCSGAVSVIRVNPRKSLNQTTASIRSAIPRTMRPPSTRQPASRPRYVSISVPVMRASDTDLGIGSGMPCLHLSAMHEEIAEDDIQARARRYGRVCLAGVVIGIVVVSRTSSGRRITSPAAVQPRPDITALVAIDIGGRLADIKIAPRLANLTSWYKAVSSRPSAKG